MRIPLTPVRFLYRAIDLYGRNTGVVCGSQRFTYAEFGERCERLAAGLVSLGVNPGERVAYLSFNNHQLLEGYFGPLLIGAVVMPLNVRLTKVELVEILNHSEASSLFFEPEFASFIRSFREHCPAIRNFVELNKEYEKLLTASPLPRPDITSFDEDSLAELFYTSGSTGAPKGVMLSHRTLYLHALATANMYSDGDTGVDIHTIPLFHANGWGRAHISTMNGVKQVMVRRFDPKLVLQLIEDEQATFMSLVPTMAMALLNSQALGTFDVSSLKKIVIGGAASSIELIRRMEQAFGCPVMAGYGLTETAPVITSCRQKNTVSYSSDEDRLQHHTMAGWPLQGTEIRVVDPQMNDIQQDMEMVGEVIVRSDNVMEGYFRDPVGTAAVLTDGWFHTGDMAVWDSENYIHIVDRKKDIIISGGENISSIEVEKSIFAHPSVLECAVVSAPDEKWGEIPVAIILLKPGQALSKEALITFLEARLAKFKHPRIVQFVSEPLPKTGTGKILKRELRETFWAGKDRRVQGG